MIKEVTSAVGISQYRLNKWRRRDPAFAMSFTTARDIGRRPTRGGPSRTMESSRAEAKATFLVNLADGHTIRESTKLAGVSKNTPYLWRKRDPAFAKEVNDILHERSERHRMKLLNEKNKKLVARQEAAKQRERRRDAIVARREEAAAKRSQRKTTFLQDLRAGHTVSEATERASVSQVTPYRWKRQDKHFAAEWSQIESINKNKTNAHKTKQKQDFVEAIRTTGEAKAAASISGINYLTAYAWRNVDPGFAKAWGEALETFRERQLSGKSASLNDLPTYRRNRNEAQRELKVSFLNDFRRHGDVTAAARAVNLRPETIHTWRRRDPEFTDEFDAIRTPFLLDQERERAAQKGKFIEHLSAFGSATIAARRAGLSNGAVYHWYDTDEDFAVQWRSHAPAPHEALATKQQMIAGKKAAFLDALQDGSSIPEAAQRIERALSTVRGWRRSDPDFRRRWDVIRGRGETHARRPEEMFQIAIESHLVQAGAVVLDTSQIPHHRRDQRGSPDVVALYKGTPLAIECKSRSGQPSRDQSDWMKKWRDNGGVAVVAHSISDVDKALGQVTSPASSDWYSGEQRNEPF